MKRTKLVIESAPNAKVTVYPMMRIMEQWQALAEKVEQSVTLKKGHVLSWRLTYNFAQDDDPESECTPQYQPLIFGTVAIIDTETLWQQQYPMVIQFEFDGYTVRNGNGNYHLVDDDKILEEIVMQLNHA